MISNAAALLLLQQTQRKTADRKRRASCHPGLSAPYSYEMSNGTATTAVYMGEYSKDIMAAVDALVPNRKEGLEMGKHKEETIDPEYIVPWEPTTAEMDLLQVAAAQGHVSELRRKLEDKLDKMRYYGEPVTRFDIEHLLEVIVDLERTLE